MTTLYDIHQAIVNIVPVQAAVVTAITDNSGGAAAIAAAITALMAAVKELSTKQAEVLTSLKNANLMASA